LSTEQITADVALADLTSFRVGGPARRLVTATTESELVAAVSECDAAGEPVLVLGGGSNVLVADDGFDGTVVRVASGGITAEESGCSGAVVEVAAGEDWDRFVAYALDQEWAGGIECLSGIPGLIGASPIQNVGAYGADLSQLVASVRTWDRRTARRATFAAADCGFGYRTSRFKAEIGRYVVLSVTFQLPLASRSAPVRYPELARRLGIPEGGRVPTHDVRTAVLALRRSKGMVLDEADHDTWSAGSFFTNPVLDPVTADALPAEAPRYPADGGVKISAAWLIEQAGFGKGYGTPPATVSTKHSLALTNRGGATAGQLLDLARQIRAAVQARFGVNLVPEPVLVGCAL
jgi:UDP-N-acetylmuramate dehydrogenase